MADAPRRLISAEKRPEDEAALRPQVLADFAGQEAARKNLQRVHRIRPRRAARRSTMCCSSARPGLGKTTLAQIVARELGVNFRSTSGPVIAKAGDLAAQLTNLEPRDVLFIDEIHRLNPGDRGDPLSGDGGFPARSHHRRGAGGALGQDRPREVHADRRDDARGPADDAAARPFRHSDPPQLLYDRGAAGHRRARRASHRPRACRRRRERDRQALARHAAHRRAAAAPRARLRGRRRRDDRHPRARRPGAQAARRRCRSASTRWTGAISTRSR